MKPVSTEAPSGGRHNPYRGPQGFRRGERLPNRQREARELTDQVIAERVVLLHSPSGAGKTSLIEAAVVDKLGEEGFMPTPRLRVNQPMETSGTANPYIHSLATYLLATADSPELSGDMTVQEAVAEWRARKQADDSLLTVLIIDQLEEILVIDPTDWDAKEGFFRELGALLRSEPVWALLSMREDYMGGLDRYLRFLPGLLRSRYRLDFLNREDAKLAMTIPARDQHVDFKDDAAEALVDRLAVVEVQKPGEAPQATSAPYVEPFQLQVVCRQLWKKIRKHRGDNFVTIEVDDVEQYADVDRALTLYFGDTVASVVAKTGADERKIRDWFESDLITNYNLRGQTLRGPDTSNADNILALLEEGYLIRGNVRALSTWYELTHDRLIRAVHASNEMWRWDTLEPWQIAAYEWNARDRHPAFLMRVEELPKGLLRNKLTDVERDFIRASESQAGQTGLPARVRSMMGFLGFVVAVESIVIVVLLALLLR
jgi:tRNA A37 threonylcarbamoyladenosine biosynthesis protein TsaE